MSASKARDRLAEIEQRLVLHASGVIPQVYAKDDVQWLIARVHELEMLVRHDVAIEPYEKELIEVLRNMIGCNIAANSKIAALEADKARLVDWLDAQSAMMIDHGKQWSHCVQGPPEVEKLTQRVFVVVFEGVDGSTIGGVFSTAEGAQAELEKMTMESHVYPFRVDEADSELLRDQQP